MIEFNSNETFSIDCAHLHSTDSLLRWLDLNLLIVKTGHSNSCKRAIEDAKSRINAIDKEIINRLGI